MEQREQVRLLRIRELSLDEIQFLVFLRDAETFPRKIIPKLYKYAKEYNYNKIVIKRNAYNLIVNFDTVGFNNPHKQIILSLRMTNGKLNHGICNTEVHPNVEAFFDALSFVQTMTILPPEVERFREYLSSLKYDTFFNVSITVNRYRISSLSLTVGNIFTSFQISGGYYYRYKLGEYYMGPVILCKVY